ncbi:MAG: hypothetical protein WC405_19920 [Syntrophales bacterium]
MSDFGIGLEPEYAPEDFPINIRFVCQGMVKVPKDKVPADLKNRSAQEIMKWAREYWRTLGRKDLLAAVAYLDIEDDTMPGAVEENDGDEYEILSATKEWDSFHETGREKVIQKP